MIVLEPIIRRSVRLLAAVHELHKQGYQDLAIYAGMSSSGYYWRCSLAPFNRILYKAQGIGLYQDYELEAANHSSGKSGNDYFGWTDAKGDNARELAEKIKHRFPKLLAKARRPNYRYVGWYSQMLGKAEQGHLPIMYQDYLVLGTAEPIPTTSKEEHIPHPPYETLWEFNGKKFAYVNGPHLTKRDDWHQAYRSIISSWRSAEIAFLPRYPKDTHDLFEIGAYWEGALYYIQYILGFDRIDEFLKCLDDFDHSSERWHTLFRVWNDDGQLELLKAFLIREMLNDVDKYHIESAARSDYVKWLCSFERTHEPYGECCSKLLPPNPYFGGNNPLHLGSILGENKRDNLINI